MGVEDVDYGDETHRYGDYVYLAHDEENDLIPEGQAVALDGTDIAAASAGDPVVGVLYTYEYFGDSPNQQVDQDQPATVKTRGTVKAEVESGVSKGDALEAGVSNAGVFDTADATDPEQANFIALTDAVAQDNDNPNGSGGESYAEVLMR